MVVTKVGQWSNVEDEVLKETGRTMHEMVALT